MGPCHHMSGPVYRTGLGKPVSTLFHLVSIAEWFQEPNKQGPAAAPPHRDPSLHGKALWASTVEFLSESIMGVLQGK